MSTRVVAQARAELALTLRRGESVLVTVAIPVGLLVFFSLVEVLPLPDAVDDPVDFLAPGMLALAVMSSAMVSLGIATGFERHYGVLERLGSTPLGRPALVTAKIVTVAGVELLQLTVLVAVALALGWRPGGSAALAALAIALGTAAFAGLGLLMAGTLPAEVNLAAANGLYLFLVLLGGVVIPTDALPSLLRAIAEALPAAALSSALAGSLEPGLTVDSGAWAVLTGWALAAPAIAAWRFRWS